MNSFYLAYYTIKRNIKDIQSMIMMSVFPIVLILILGTALNHEFTVRNLTKAKICYLNEDSGKISESFNEFLNKKGVREVLEVKKVLTYDEGYELIKNNNYDALIVIDKDYSKNIKENKKAIINVYNKKQGNLKGNIVKNLIDSYVNAANTMEAVYKLNSKTIEYKLSYGIKEMPISSNGKIPRAIDYYAVTMLVMTIMYGSM